MVQADGSSLTNFTPVNNISTWHCWLSKRKCKKPLKLSQRFSFPGPEPTWTPARNNVQTNKRHLNPQDGAELRFHSHQPDTSLCCECETMDTEPVHCLVCPSMPPSSLVRYLLCPPQTHGQAELTSVYGWLHTEMVYPLQDSHPSQS